MPAVFLDRSSRGVLAGFSLPQPDRNIPEWKHEIHVPSAEERAARQQALDEVFAAPEIKQESAQDPAVSTVMGLADPLKQEHLARWRTMSR